MTRDPAPPLSLNAPSAGGEARSHLLAFGAYLLLTLAVAAPLLPRLSSGIPHDTSDPLLNAWLLQWNARMLPLSTAWWNAPFFHPVPGVLSFSESLLGLSPLASPLSWLGLGPIATYNVMLLLSFALSAQALYALGRALSLSRGAAFVAGLAFGFAPYRAGHLAHLQILSVYWMPLLFLGAHRYLDSGRARWLLLFAGAWALQGLANGYYLVFVSLLLAVWLAWFAPAAGRLRRAAALVIAWLLAAAALAPTLLRYRAWHLRYGFQRTAAEVQELSADLLGLLSPAPALAHGPAVRLEQSESWLFPGLTVPLLLLGLLLVRRREPHAEHGRLAALFVGFAAAAATVAALTALIGPWRLALGPLTLSVKALSKPLALAFYSLLLAAVASRALQALWRRASAPAFYLLAGFVMLAFAFGPQARCAGSAFWDKAPYFFLMKLPGLDALRAPARFAMPSVFCLALAAGFALDRFGRAAARQRRALLALAAAGVAWDGWIARLPVHSAPVPSALARATDAAAVLELPLGPERDPAAMIRALDHGRPVWNGYSGHVPAHYHALTLGLERREGDVLRALRERGSLLILLDRSTAGADEIERFILNAGGASFLGEEDGRAAFRLQALPPPAEPERGVPLPARASRGDGRRAVYELERSQPIAAVALHADPWRLPRHVTLEVAERPGAWALAFEGPVAGLAVRDGLRDPGRHAVVLPTPGARGRLLRLRLVEGGFDGVTVYAAASP